MPSALILIVAAAMGMNAHAAEPFGGARSRLANLSFSQARSYSEKRTYSDAQSREHVEVEERRHAEAQPRHTVSGAEPRRHDRSTVERSPSSATERFARP